MEPFFDSVNRAFERNRDEGGPRFIVGVALLLLALLGWVVWSSRRAARAHEAALRDASQRVGLGDADLVTLRTWCSAAGTLVEDAMRSLASFERVTAQALSERPSADVAERVSRFRAHLGFGALPPWAPLFTTRELAVGLEVTLLRSPECRARVSDVAEGQWRLVAPPDFAAGLTDPVALSVTHGDEARYELRCAVKRVEPGGLVTLGHDEAPVRVQLRAFARIQVDSFMSLAPVTGPDSAPIQANLRDVSAGGALVRAPAALPVGQLVETTFELGRERFVMVGAVVVKMARESPRELYEVHLEFCGVDDPLRDRLVAAVTALAAAAKNAA